MSDLTDKEVLHVMGELMDWFKARDIGPEGGANVMVGLLGFCVAHTDDQDEFENDISEVQDGVARAARSLREALVRAGACKPWFKQ
jgi:hypothetical protein